MKNVLYEGGEREPAKRCLEEEYIQEEVIRKKYIQKKLLLFSLRSISMTDLLGLVIPASFV